MDDSRNHCEDNTSVNTITTVSRMTIKPDLYHFAIDYDVDYGILVY